MFKSLSGFLKIGLLAAVAWFSYRSGKQDVQVKQQHQEVKQQEELKEVVLDAKEIDDDVDRLSDNAVDERLHDSKWFRD